MKKSTYDKLIQTVANFNDGVANLVLYTSDNEYAADKYGNDLEEMRKKLGEGKQIIDQILTIDMESFIKAFMKQLKGKAYEVVTIDIEDQKLYVAKPKDVVLASADDLFDNQEVYILGANDTKVLSRPSVTIGDKVFPVVSLSNGATKGIYHNEFTRYNEKYLKFKEFTNSMADHLVKKSKQKKISLISSKR